MYSRVLIVALLLVCINYKYFYNSYIMDQWYIFTYKVGIYFILFLFVSSLFLFSKRLHHLWLIFLLFLSLFIVYYVNTMGIVINKDIIRNIFATNIDESMELLKIQFLVYIIFWTIMLVALYRIFFLKWNKLNVKQYLFLMFSLTVVFVLITKLDEAKYKKIIKYETPKVVPLSFFPALGNYLRTKSREEKIVKKNISSYFTYNKKHKQPQIGVLIIGESARSDRFSINGYSRNTTPLLSSTKNLISFNSATSCDTSTLSSVPCLMIREDKNIFSFPVKETSFVQILRDKGINTYWLNLQDEHNTIHTFCEEARECIDFPYFVYDEEILPKFKKIIKSIQRDTLIVIHSKGSHMEYNKRVPQKYKIYQPVCIKSLESCTQESINNSYDNTIYYTDMFLSRMIKTLKRKNAFLLYVSDHGESLGERYLSIIKRFGHASPYDVAPKEQISIPFIMWFSAIFQEYNLSINNLDKSKHVTHDYVFHTMLGCFGISGNYINNNLNLCYDH